VRRDVQGCAVRAALFKRRLHDPSPSYVVADVVVSAVERNRPGRLAVVAPLRGRGVPTAAASKDSQPAWTIRYVS